MWEIHKSGSVRGVDATSHGKEYYGKEAINVYSTNLHEWEVGG
jgi:hypothetical protein